MLLKLVTFRRDFRKPSESFWDAAYFCTSYLQGYLRGHLLDYLRRYISLHTELLTGTSFQPIAVSVQLLKMIAWPQMLCNFKLPASFGKLPESFWGIYLHFWTQVSLRFDLPTHWVLPEGLPETFWKPPGIKANINSKQASGNPSATLGNLPEMQRNRKGPKQGFWQPFWSLLETG